MKKKKHTLLKTKMPQSFHRAMRALASRVRVVQFSESHASVPKRMTHGINPPTVKMAAQMAETRRLAQRRARWCF